MPTELSLRHKLSEKLKISKGKSKNSREEKKMGRGAMAGDKSHKKEMCEEEVESSGKVKEVHRSQERSVKEAYGKGRQEHMSSDKSHKKEYGGNKNLDSWRKVKEVRRGQDGSVKEAYDKGRHECMSSDKSHKKEYAGKKS